MSRSTISEYQLFQMFPDQEAARTFMEQKRWPDGVQCPHCQEDERIGTRKGGYYRCNACMEVFTVRTKTVMERSHIPLNKWILGMYKLVTARKGISSVQLAKELGIRQASAWFMLQRLREACRTPHDPLRGIVEMDETFIGGFEGNKHESKKLKAGRGPVGKAPVIGMRERKGRVIASTLDGTDRDHIHRAVFSNVEPGSVLHTDDHRSYTGLNGLFDDHHTVKHSTKEYVNGAMSTPTGLKVYGPS